MKTLKALCIIEDLDRPSVETFVGLQRAGIDLAVIAPRPSLGRAALEGAGLRVLDIELRSHFDLAGIRALRGELQRERYDVLHLFGNRSLQNGLLAATHMPIGIVAYRGIVGNVNALNPVDWLRFLNPRIDRIVCVADAVRGHFLQMRPAFLRVPEHRLVRIYKGHGLDWYAHPPADLRELGVPEGAFVVGCAANYRPRKGIEVLVQALAGLPADVHLLLVGRMDAPALARKIAASPAAARIHRVGFREDAPSLTPACDAFVLPSTKREGLARSLIEAMAQGVPPVVTDCGGSPELVVDGVSGLVVPVRDAAAITEALARLHADADLRRRIGDAARERIRTSFRIEDTIEQTLALYRSLASTAG